MGAYTYAEMNRTDAYILNEMSLLECFVPIWKYYVNDEITMIGRIRALLRKTFSSKFCNLNLASTDDSIKTKEVTEHKEDKQKYSNSIIEIAETEVKRFHQSRLREMKGYLISYIERQIQISRDTQNLISDSILDLNEFLMPREKARKFQ